MLEIKLGDADPTEREQLTLDVRTDCDTPVPAQGRTGSSALPANTTSRSCCISTTHASDPREAFKGKTGQGDWADSLAELNADFGTLLDLLDELGIANDTLVVFAGDNGAEDTPLWRGSPGYWEGSYFAGGEGNLRTACIARWPGQVSAGVAGDEIMQVTDWPSTILAVVGVPIPNDRVIDSLNQLDTFLRRVDAAESGAYARDRAGNRAKGPRSPRGSPSLASSPPASEGLLAGRTRGLRGQSAGNADVGP